MIDVRTVLEVLHPHGSGRVESSAVVQEDDDRCYDVFPTNDHQPLDESSFSSEAFWFLTENKERINSVASGVLRLMTSTERYSCGSAIRLFDDVVVSNYHVINEMGMLSLATASSTKVILVSNRPEVSHREIRANQQICSTIRKFIRVFDRDRYPSRENEIDPILGSIGNFNIIDCIPLELRVNPNDQALCSSNVLFVPSSRTVPPGTPVITISYPGSELLVDHPPYPAPYQRFLEPFSVVKQKFHGFGKRIVSYGHSIYPYHLKDELWVENRSFEPNTETELCVLSNECVVSGSSGGATLRHDFETEEVTDRNGKKWLLVEYNSVHFGGEFVPCSECISQKEARDLTPESIINLGNCHSCKNGNRRSIAYNYGVSVHHPALVEFYNGFMRSKFDTLFDSTPILLEKYFKQHS